MSLRQKIGQSYLYYNHRSTTDIYIKISCIVFVHVLTYINYKYTYDTLNSQLCQTRMNSQLTMKLRLQQSSQNTTLGFFLVQRLCDTFHAVYDVKCTIITFDLPIA